jgi:lactate dehydrogenase-like 2-hydroxyacid dehydrogenase
MPGQHAFYDEFFETIAEHYNVVRYDPSRPAQEQFQGIGAVVDMGGWASTRELIGAGAASGVRLWQVATTGLDHVDVDCPWEKGLTLSRSPGSAPPRSRKCHTELRRALR